MPGGNAGVPRYCDSMNIKTDFLVIGTGIAGLSFALKAAEVGDVAIVTKKGAIDSNTNLAQGGIASVFSGNDSFDLHIQDTLQSGDGLCNPDVVKMVVKSGPECIRELMSFGVKFNIAQGSDRDVESLQFDLGREGGHSENMNDIKYPLRNPALSGVRYKPWSAPHYWEK